MRPEWIVHEKPSDRVEMGAQVTADTAEARFA